jgi:hypothetical protein
MPEIPTKNSPEYKDTQKKNKKYLIKALQSQAKDKINITGKP